LINEIEKEKTTAEGQEEERGKLFEKRKSLGPFGEREDKSKEAGHSTRGGGSNAPSRGKRKGREKGANGT